jgi:methyl-accepting chemotaxis protein
MKLRLKLPLTFALSLLLLLGGALIGIFQLNQAVRTFEDDVLHHVAGYKKGAEISTHFAAGIQEWKNVLLRGKNLQDMEKHWSAHTKAMQEVNQRIQELGGLVDSGSTSEKLVNQLAQEMHAAQEGYRQAFEAFKAAERDFAAGDAAAKGKDRSAATTLTALLKELSREETSATEDAQREAKSATRISLAIMASVSLFALFAAIRLSQQIVRSLSTAVTVAQQVAQGDLTNTIEVHGHDEIAALFTALKSMQDKLVTLVGDVRQGAQSVANASSEIAHGNNDLSARTEQQASALQQTSSSMSQLSATVGQSADSARQAHQLADNASTVAVRGGEVVAQVVQTMSGINDSSKKIADIISVIDGIAFQTNILALNAAVEAARAGEQGRGFAVVASEVRALAGRSADAAKEIKSLINASVERVEHGTELVNQAGATMHDVVNAIQRVADIVGEISAASVEQSTGVGQVGQAIDQIDQATQQNAALVEEMAAAASGLKGQSSDLVHSVSLFKLAANASARSDAATAPATTRALAHSTSPKPPKNTSQLVKRASIPAAAQPKTNASAAPARANAVHGAPGHAEKTGKTTAVTTAQADEEWETF